LIERGGLHNGAEILQKFGVPPCQKSLDLGLRSKRSIKPEATTKTSMSSP